MVCMCNHRIIAPRISIALVLSIVLLAAPAWADFNAGEKAYQSGDYSTALREWQPLAEQGQAGSQYQLGLLYANGKGVARDDAKARLWYEKAAIQGHTEAQVNLGVMLMYARGGQQDYKMAVYYLRLAANQGHDVAQRRLGELYQRGEGVQQDFIKAYMWYSLGSAHGAEAGARLRDALAKQMDPDQIAEAQKLAREWKPKAK
jgi:TPR repeat protein